MNRAVLRITTIEGQRHYSGIDPKLYAAQRQALISPKGGDTMFRFLAKLFAFKKVAEYFRARRARKIRRRY